MTSLSSSYNTIKTKLEQIDQLHLLKFWDQLNDQDRTNYLKQLQTINFDRVNEIFAQATASLDTEITNTKRMEPIPRQLFESVENCSRDILDDYRQRGYQAIVDGEVAVLLMAGGQGSRLGVAYPKGMYSVGLPSGKTLFQLQAERIRRVQQLARDDNNRVPNNNIRGTIPWYIMTSGPTDDTTKKYLEANDYFGLRASDVILFKQGLQPCYNFDGKLIMESDKSLSLAPDGNGGIYRALADNGILDDMERRGIKHVHIHSVDNILTKVADPVFIGYSIAKGAECAAKVVKKSSPTEAVGVVCQVNGHFQVVEYSELPENLAKLTDADGDLVFRAGSICNHYINVAFLREIADTYEIQLKLHVAKKKIPYADANTGKTIKPHVPNGIKIEKFVFDVFQFAKQFVTWEVPRYTEFSPLKNADQVGKDCATTARNDLLALHRIYIEKAGGQISDNSRSPAVEISPLLSYAGENLCDKCDGKVFDKDCVLLGDEENEINGLV